MNRNYPNNQNINNPINNQNGMIGVNNIENNNQNMNNNNPIINNNQNMNNNPNGMIGVNNIGNNDKDIGKYNRFFNKMNYRRGSILDKQFRPNHYLSPNDADDLFNMYYIPENIKPICGENNVCENGVLISSRYDRSRAIYNYDYFDNNKCEGESMLNINSTYLLKYRKSKEEHMVFTIHMILMYSVPKNAQGVQKLQEMFGEYCSGVNIVEKEPVNILFLCNRLARKSFNYILEGEYYYENNKLMVETHNKKEKSNGMFVEYKATECRNNSPHSSSLKGTFMSLGNITSAFRSKTM